VLVSTAPLRDQAVSHQETCHEKYNKKYDILHPNPMMILKILVIITLVKYTISIGTTFTPEEIFATMSSKNTLLVPTSESSSLQYLIDNTDPKELQSMLINLGYPHASLGQKNEDVTSTTTTDQKLAGQYCQTHVQSHHMTLPSGTTLPSDYIVFVEEDNSIVAHDKITGDPVECSCDEFDCTCQKQCFCKSQSQPFPTHQPAACPVCKTCDGGVPIAKEDDDKKVEPDTKPNPAPHEFKCSCSFDGAGGTSSGSSGNTEGIGAMDCDCKVSDCSCTRKCKCRAT
jgi:hypothetical protein